MSVQDRMERVRRRMVERELDALFVDSPENRLYLSGFRGTAGYLFITPSEAVLATDFRYVEQATGQAPDYRVLRIGGPLDWFKGLASDTGSRRIGMEADHLTVSLHRQLLETLKGLEPAPEMVPTTSLVDELRAVKEPEELAVLERAVEIADQAMEQVAEGMRPGMTELQVAWRLEVAMRELGAEAISFDTIVAAGPNAALPHHRPTERPIGLGESVVIDMGARYQGYCSDISRTVVLGKGDDTFRQVYDTVLAAQETASATVRTGMTGGELHELAHMIIGDAGYRENFGHSLGHGIGLAVHEHPRVGPNSPTVLEEGFVFTVEPGIYLSGWGGVRIEDMVVMENGHARVLTAAHKRDLVPV